MKTYHLRILLGCAITATNTLLARAQGGTRWATIIGTDSFGADVFPDVSSRTHVIASELDQVLTYIHTWSFTSHTGLRGIRRPA